jgi:hypothetical protein
VTSPVGDRKSPIPSSDSWPWTGSALRSCLPSSESYQQRGRIGSQAQRDRFSKLPSSSEDRSRPRVSPRGAVAQLPLRLAKRAAPGPRSAPESSQRTERAESIEDHLVRLQAFTNFVEYALPGPLCVPRKVRGQQVEWCGWMGLEKSVAIEYRNEERLPISREIVVFPALTTPVTTIKLPPGSSISLLAQVRG